MLVGNYVGLGALAHEVGFSFWWMALSTVLIWAAPAQVIWSRPCPAALLEVALAHAVERPFPAHGGGILPTMQRVRQRVSSCRCI